MTTMLARIEERLRAEDGVIGRIALVIVILALIVVFALIAFIIPGSD
jgi:hypothetical protein